MEQDREDASNSAGPDVDAVANDTIARRTRTQLSLVDVPIDTLDSYLNEDLVRQSLFMRLASVTVD